jgi:hypothetical protein
MYCADSQEVLTDLVGLLPNREYRVRLEKQAIKLHIIIKNLGPNTDVAYKDL